MKLIASTLVLVLALLTVAPAIAGYADPEEAVVFRKIRLLVPDGEESKSVEVFLRFEEKELSLTGKKSGEEMKRFAYADLKSAEYSYSKHPRWKSGAGVAIAVGILALPIFFMKGKKHWLTVKTDDDFVVLQLDKKNYQVVIPTFETRTGLDVETVEEEKD